MKNFINRGCVLAALVALTAGAAGQTPSRNRPAEVVEASRKPASLTPADVEGFDSYPPATRALLEDALELTAGDLGYKYGSADPEAGGMDCSGTIYYLLKSHGIEDVPRSSAAIYRWAWMNSRMYPVSSSELDTFELSALKPGDLLFWSGTYDIDRDPPITHVMLYLGKSKESGRPLMVGASNGRSFRGVPRYGVSVFDFKLPDGRPRGGRVPRFSGYASIPGLGGPSDGSGDGAD